MLENARYIGVNNLDCRTQWPRGLRHELSSPTETLLSWVRAPFETWVSVSVFITRIFVLFCVQVAALLLADTPVQEVPPTVYR
jgi:hypothetical protein